jgi:aldose sugar dehydrogenase
MKLTSLKKGKEYYGPSIGEGTQKEGMKQPLKYFVPSIAPSGLIVYSGKDFKELRGHFISGSLVLKHLNIVSPDAKKEVRLFEDKKERVREVVESPNGKIYFATDKGKIYRLVK